MVHRVRYRRLWRLPSVKAIGTAAIAAAIAALASALFAPLWTGGVVLVVAAAGIAVYVGTRRDRIAIEIRMARALTGSAGRCSGDVAVPGLSAEVRAVSMPDGVTRIDADSWLDAVRALGYVMGRDRGFQMDLLRRTASGRLAEVWGRTALPSDRRYRALGLTRVADLAAESLATPERELLTAFSAGVDAAWSSHGAPFECRFLSYRPRPWTVQDSLVIALYLFHGLSWNERAKRAEAVVRRALPDDAACFFLPDDAGARPPLPADLARLRSSTADADVIEVDSAVPGSNCWVKGGQDGPVLACDLHLALAMPNLLYEVDMSWPGTRLRGLAAPGLPAVLTGTNGRVVWGVTNLTADVLDLVTAGGDLVTDTERIRVRGREDAVVDQTWDGTMPVSAEPLLGEKIAVRWAGHDVRGCDLRFQRLAHVSTVEQGIMVLDDADGIALNVLLADESGRMAHLATGLLPRRPAGEQGVAHGHLAGSQRPKLVDPESGILVSANDAALPEHPFRIGYDLDPGHRARRARQVLTETKDTGLAALRALQHDLAADVYLPYRDFAVSALADRDAATADLLGQWDGRADAGSRAFAILVRLRELLAQRVLAPYLSVCRDHDPGFQYPFRSFDRPLLAILAAGDRALLPADVTRDDLVAGCVAQAMADLRGRTGTSQPSWGQLNSVGLAHPLSGLAPWSAPLLDIAPKPEPGCLYSVRTCVPGFAAVGRAVLSPGAGGVAAFETPGGQSGHPLSARYGDRHSQWSSGSPRAGRQSRTGCAFALRPTNAGSEDQ
ncbi:Penicillin acylase II [Alloactinosynnema sp. L-07]|nr:Penicillin acylase II [Alloactinosynnema sp. L-07]